jgi:hypothetical protein
MNAVICTDGTSILVKASLADVPDMKGLELAPKFPQRNLFMEMNTVLIE